MLSAALLKSDGSTRLLTNGRLRFRCTPALHAGDAKVVKSPASIAAVGTNARLSDGLTVSFVPWYPKKKNKLLVLIGPPSVTPYWFRFRPSSLRLSVPGMTPANGSVAFRL